MKTSQTTAHSPTRVEAHAMEPELLPRSVAEQGRALLRTAYLYKSRTVTSVRQYTDGKGREYRIFDFDGLQPIVVPVLPRTARQRHIARLLCDPTRPVWTMRELIHALELEYSTGVRGQVGRDLKAIGAYNRRTSRGRLYSAAPFDASNRRLT